MRPGPEEVALKRHASIPVGEHRLERIQGGGVVNDTQDIRKEMDARTF